MKISSDKYAWIKEYKFFKKLCELPFVDEIWLYGSRARGDNQERSDIDLAIVCPRATRNEWYALMEIMSEDEVDTLLDIDCVRFDEIGEDNPFKKNIVSDRVVLYQRKGIVK
jgi:predicted nucleotidyltransferase